METYRITFYREDETAESQDCTSETVDIMAIDELDAAKTFQLAEPFCHIINVQKI